MGHGSSGNILKNAALAVDFCWDLEAGKDRKKGLEGNVGTDKGLNERMNE